MAPNYRQPKGFAVYQGVPLGIWGGFATGQLATQLSPAHHRAVTDFGPRDSKPAPKKCDRKRTQYKGFFQPDVHCPQKRRRLEASYQPKTSQHLPDSPSLQNGGYQQPKGCATGRHDFMGKINLEDAYLAVPICHHHRNFLKFQWKGKNYRFKALPFSLATAPRVFIKILRPLAARMRQTCIRMVIYLDDILVMARTKEMLISHMETKEMFLETDTVNRIPGIPSQLHDDDHQFAHRQSPEGFERMQTHDEVSNSSRSGSLDRNAVFNDTSRHSGTSPIPSSPEASPQNTIKLTRRIRPADSHQQRSRSRSPLVGRTPARIQ
jgi:hypothetical protein